MHRVTVSKWASHHPAFVSALATLRRDAAFEARDAALRTTRAALDVVFRVDQYAGTWTPIVLKGAAGNGSDRNYSLWVNSDGRVSFGSGNEYLETVAGTVTTPPLHSRV